VGVNSGAGREFAHWVMCSKGILVVLVNDKAGMDGKDGPRAAKSELLCEFMRAEVDKIDPISPVN